MRNQNILKILHHRRTASRISPFGKLTAETLLSAYGRPTCMRSGQATVGVPHFRPVEGRIVSFGELAAETGLSARPCSPLEPDSSESSPYLVTLGSGTLGC